MSGGSFSYLGYAMERRDPIDTCELRRMVRAVDAYGAQGGRAMVGAHHDLAAMLDLLEEAENLGLRLAKFALAVEWHDSGDTGLGDVIAAAEDYNKENGRGEDPSAEEGK